MATFTEGTNRKAFSRPARPDSIRSFMMGPSAAADVEATLVHGAQGARSLNIFFLPRG
jgi:L-lactate utilization protein LutC